MLFLIWTIDIVIFVCLSQSKFNSNMYLRKIVLFICSQLYNLILGYYTYMMFILLIGLNLLVFNNEAWYFLALIIESLVLFVSFLLPVNWVAEKECKINLIIYIITTILTIFVGILISYF